MEDILLIDKPVGITSFDVIRRLRKEFREKNGKKAPRMGHAGTLDPLASGLMLIGVGEGTKKLREYVKLPKEYIAEILIGERRSTGDMEGEVLEEADVGGLGKDVYTDVCTSMIGTHELPVSPYSAIKKDGVPMYERARKAAESKGSDPLLLDNIMRKMQVFEAVFLNAKNLSVNRKKRVVVKVRFYVGSGTYIRSLAEEFGRRLGCPATLKSLRRTKIGKFDIKNARKI